MCVRYFNIGNNEGKRKRYCECFTYYQAKCKKKKLMTLFLSNKGKVEGSIYLVS